MMNFLYIAAGALYAVFEENRNLREAVAMERDELARIRQQRDSYEQDRRRMINRMSALTILMHQAGYAIIETDNSIEIRELSLGDDSPLQGDGDDAVK